MLPPVIPGLTTGASTTCPSMTIAMRRPTFECIALSNRGDDALVKLTDTVQPDPGMSRAPADWMSARSTIGAPRR